MNLYNVDLCVFLNVKIEDVIAENEESAIKEAIAIYNRMTPDEIYRSSRLSGAPAELLDVSLIEENVDEEGNPVEEDEEEEEDEVES